MTETTNNRFYTIINLEKYKEKFADGSHKNDNESTIDLQKTYSSSTNNTEYIQSLNDQQKGFYNMKKQQQTYQQQEFQIEGRSFDHYIDTNNYGTFQDAQKQHVIENLKINNNIGFGYYQEGSYKEFGDMIVPGPNSKIKDTSSSVFFCGLKGAQGGGGGAGGANETWEQSGGAGGNAGNTRGAWVFPSSSNVSTVTFQESVAGNGGGGGEGGEWGWQRGSGGQGGQEGNDTFIKFKVNEQNSRKFIITGSGGGSGGEGGGRGGGSGGNGSRSQTGFTNAYVEEIDGYDYVYNSIKGVSGGSRTQGGSRNGKSGTKGNNGKIGQFIYLTGSKANHNS